MEKLFPRFCGKKWALTLGVAICATAAASGQEVLELTLSKAIEIAVSENPTIKVAEKEIELKKLSKDEAWQNLLPSADFSGSIQYTVLAATMKLNDMEFKMGKDNTSTWNGQFSVSLPIFAPTVYATINMTADQLRQAVEQSRSSRIDLVNQVTKAFYSLILAQDSYDVLLKSYDQAQKNFEVINRLYELGGTSEYDKISAEVQVRSIHPTVISAKNAVSIAQLQLKVLMGITASVDLVINESLEDYEGRMLGSALSPDTCSLEGNTSLRQLDINKDMLYKTIKLQKTNFMPTMALVGSYSYQSLYNENFKVNHYDWAQSSNLVLSLSVPIFKMTNFTKLKQTKLQISQLEENRSYVERQLDMQVNTYLNTMKADTEKMLSNKEAIVQAQKGRDIAEKRYEVGKGTILELNNSEVSLTQARLTYSQSIYDYLSAQADLEKVTGSGRNLYPDKK